MSDLMTQLREYGSQLDDMASPLSELVDDTPPLVRTVPSRRRGWMAAPAAAVAVLILIGGTIWLFAGGGSDVVDQPGITTPVEPEPVSTLAESITATTGPPDSNGRLVPAPGPPPVTGGTWTVYGPLPGLASSRLLLAVDGNGDVFAVSQETGDVSAFATSGTSDDGPRDVSPVPDQIRGRWIYWMVGLPDGGLLYGYAATSELDLGGVIGFDGSEWFSPTLPDGTPLVLRGVSAVEVGKDGAVWIADFGDDQARLFHFADGVWAEWAAPAAMMNPGAWNAGSRVSLAPDGAFWSVTRAEDGAGGAARQYDEVIDLFDFERSGDTCCLAWVQAAPNGDVWVHADVGVDRYRNGQWTHFDAGAGQHPDDYAIPTSDGSLWLSGHGRISHFDGQFWNTYTPAEARALAIPVMKQGAQLVPFVNTADGITWVLTRDAVLHRHDGTSWSIIEPPADIDLSSGSLIVTPEGQVWVGAGGQFVALFEPQS